MRLSSGRSVADECAQLADLICEQIRNLLGGNILYLSSGAAPLMTDVHEMLKVCFSCDVIQGVSGRTTGRAVTDDDCSMV